MGQRRSEQSRVRAGTGPFQDRREQPEFFFGP